jgi:hypothetical protein
MVKAAKTAGLDPDAKKIQEKILGLGSEALRELIFQFLIYQSNYSWSNRCAIEAQMDENIKIRLKPIESDKGDKDIIDASTKKNLLTEHFAEYQDTIRKLDNEIFSDHETIRDSSVRKKTTLESLIK